MLRFGLIALGVVLIGCSSSSDESELGDGGEGADGGSSGSTSNGGRAPNSGGTSGKGSSAGRGVGKGGTAQAGATGSGGTSAARGGTGGGAGTGGSSGSGNATGGTSDLPGGTGNVASRAGGGGAATNHTNPLNQDLIDAFVKAHNDARESALVPTPSPVLPPVTWDAVLADSAYNYLSKCQSKSGDLVDHNDSRTKDYAALGGSDSVGENIYASTASTVEPADAVSEWMKEANDYVPGNLSSAGHYTQVVWRGSKRIGCAIVNCPSVRFHNTVLCNYAPAGNVTGQMPY